MTADLGPAATPRPIPTTEDRMSRPDHIPAPRATGCGHTVDQHHRLAGLEADTRSQDQAAERDDARNALIGVKQQRDRLDQEWQRRVSEAAAIERALERAGFERPTFRAAELIDQLAAQRDTLRTQLDDTLAIAAFRRDVIARHRDEITAAGRTIVDLRQQRDRYVADLTDAGNEVDQLTADLRRARQQLGRAQELLANLRHLDEQRDRAWAAYDTVSEPEERHDWYPDHDGLCIVCHLPDGQCHVSPEKRRETATPTPSLGSPAPTQEPGKPCTGCHACHDDPGTSSPAEADAADAHLGDPAGYEIVATRLYRDRRGQLVSGSVVVASAVSTRPTLVEAVDELRHAISPAEQTED